MNGDLGTTIEAQRERRQRQGSGKLAQCKCHSPKPLNRCSVTRQHWEPCQQRILPASGTTTNTIAQPFTVGSNEYSLNYIQVDFAAPSQSVEVRVCAEDSTAGKAGSIDCSQYTGETTPSAGLHTYELAVEKILSASKRYYVVICGTAGSISVHLTDGTNEVRDLGWNLEDSHVAGVDDGNTTPLNQWTSGIGIAKVKLIGYQIVTGQAPTPTPSPTPSPTPTLTPTATGSPTATPTITPTPTVTPTGSPTATPTITPTPTPTGSATATPTVTATPVAGPGVAPSGLRVEARTQTTATISWIPGADATRHIVIAQASGEPLLNFQLGGGARSYTFTGLKPKVYRYTVIAMDANGNYSAPDGTSYSASVTGSGPPAQNVKPTGLSVNRTGSTATLTWTPGPDAVTQIAAARRQGDRASMQVSGSLNGAAGSYTFTGMKQGAYEYLVIGLDANGNFRGADGTWYFAAATD